MLSIVASKFRDDAEAAAVLILTLAGQETTE